MPSTYSISYLSPLDSSTVMTPSLPTFSMTSAMSSPISVSWAEREATWAICSLPDTGVETFWISSRTAATAISMPRLMAIGLAPAVTFLKPSCTMAWAKTVAVVVPSPATSLVLVAASLRSWAPMFSSCSSSSISLAMVTPSLLTCGGPNFLSRMTLRPLGPRVTLTVSAKASTPRMMERRASSACAICFPAMTLLGLLLKPALRRAEWAGRA